MGVSAFDKENPQRINSDSNKLENDLLTNNLKSLKIVDSPQHKANVNGNSTIQTIDFTHSNLFIMGTIQFNTCVRKIEEKLNLKSSQIKPLSRGEVLGCTSPILPKNSVCVFISDGRFHLESLMQRNKIKFYRYCPFNKKMYKEVYNHIKSNELMKIRIENYKTAKKVGVIRSLLGRQGNYNIVKSLVDHIKKEGKMVYYFEKDEIIELNFKEIDVYVQVGCPRLGMDWSTNFKNRVLMPSEVLKEDIILNYYSKEEGNYKN